MAWSARAPVHQRQDGTSKPWQLPLPRCGCCAARLAGASVRCGWQGSSPVVVVCTDSGCCVRAGPGGGDALGGGQAVGGARGGRLFRQLL